MGDRHNIGIVQRQQNILWLYSHHGFFVEKPEVEDFKGCVALALDEARPRWDDESYFARIVIHTLGESVRGINAGKCTMDEHERYVLDTKTKSVYCFDDWRWDGDWFNMPKTEAVWSFDEFVDEFRLHDRTVRDEY